MQKNKKFTIKQEASHREEHEFPKGEKGVDQCKVCRAVYYKKSWRHEQMNLEGLKTLSKGAPFKVAVCPACKMIANHEFEGEIVLKNVPKEIAGDLKHAAENFCQRAYEKDSQHRLIKMKDGKEGLTITTTENQLAVKLAKKLQEDFKNKKWKIEKKISYSAAPGDAVYVHMEFVVA